MSDQTTLEPYYDRERHTILKINDGGTGKEVKYIPLDIVEGLKIVSISRTKFDGTFKPIPDYPIDKAVGLFVGYAKTLGASKEVMTLLCGVAKISKEDVDKSLNRKKEESKVAPVKEKKLKEGVTVKGNKESDTKPVKKTKSVLPPQKSAAQMFKDLIMEGKLTDDQIFKEVQDNFNIGDSKRSYVKWYRNYLIKEGKNPPKAVESKPTKKASK